jgi:hypothetical protein
MSLDPSVRRQGAVEALNLIARSLCDAVALARSEAKPDEPDNFVAGQLMALGHVLGCIERERDLLQQQLMQEAGLHVAPSEPVWDAEMALLSQLPLTSEELFRLAMDFRKVEEYLPPDAVEEGSDANLEAEKPAEEALSPST